MEQWKESFDVTFAASMAGLAAAGQITSYVMSKHAVVGDPDRLANDTLRAIERNKALLVAPRQARFAWLFTRLAPGLLQRMSIRFVAQQRAQQAAHSPGGP